MALSIVVANMIGTGIFTTTGLLLADISNPLAVLIAWVVGGLVALCGALTYAELGVAMPESGGEYHYLSKLFHPALGFLSGWISLIVGFSAPIAAVAIAFAEYSKNLYSGLAVVPTAIAVVILFSIFHLFSVRTGGRIHSAFTWIKVVLIIGIIAGGIAMTPEKQPELTFTAMNWNDLVSPAFATGLILVMYSYSGWNAAAYLGGEIRNPGRNIPMALIIGTVLVTLLYAGLNYFYLAAVPSSALSGKVEVAHIVGQEIFGPETGLIVTVVVALACLSSVSGMIMTGPRVYQKIGEDHPTFRLLDKRSKGDSPYVAILLQMAVAIVMILTFSFQTILTYVGFTLSLFAGLAVAGIFVLRQRNNLSGQRYKTWGYPVVPIVFLLVMAWMIAHSLFNKPLAALTGLGTMAVGAVIYFIGRQK